MQLHIFEAIKWGSDGTNDTVLLVSAFSVKGAAELADEHLRNVRPQETSAFVDEVRKIAADPRVGNPVVIMGPCDQLAYDYGWESWERDRAEDDWKRIEKQK